MSKENSSYRLVAAIAIATLCLSPAAFAADDSSPLSVVEIVKEVIADISDWFGAVVLNQSGAEDDGEGEDNTGLDLGPNVDPIG